MKRFIPRTALGLSLSLVALAGCACYREVVDPCWPQRYAALARQSVNDTDNAQTFNGHVLDQTVWNYYFEHDTKSGAPTDRLNPAGIERLKYISRRRPAPDTRIFLATAQDIPGLADQPPEKITAVRAKLDADRVAAVQKFLAAQTGGHAPYSIEIHDPAEVGMAAMPIIGSLSPGLPRPVIGGYQKMQDAFQGVLPAESGTSSGGGGSLGGGSSGGGSSGGGAPPR